MGIFNKIKGFFVGRNAILKEPFSEMVVHTANRYIHNPQVVDEFIKKFSKKTKEKIITELTDVSNKIALAEDQILANREFLVKAVLAEAQYGVVRKLSIVLRHPPA